MKLTLIVPNYRLAKDAEHMYYAYAPYNLCVLAARVEDICEVEIIDAYVDDMSRPDLEAAIRKSAPDVAGITVLMDQMAHSGHDVAGIVKKISPNILTILGGVYATMNPMTAVEDDNFDYICVGEGEYVLRDLIKFLKKEAPSLPEKGLVYKENGKIVDKGRSAFIEDLNAIPLPAYHLIDFDKYSKEVSRRNSVDCPRTFPYARLHTSRGCPFGCSFCQVGAISGKTFRYRSVEKVIEEIKLLKDRYGIKSFIVSESNFLFNRKRVEGILNAMIEQDLVMPWLSEDTGVMHMDKDLLKLMRKSGCEYMGCAIETGNDRVMNEIIQGKRFSKEHAIEVVSFAKELGMYVAANFIIGFPTETWDEIRETLRFAELLNADYTRIFNLVPLKNTKLWDICEKDGFFKEGYDHFNMTASWNASSVRSNEYSPNDLTVLRVFEWDRINFGVAEKRIKTAKRLEMTEEDLKLMRKKTRDNLYASIK
ncbi:MAG: B12-binding domain-containing radical SAM protein [Nitrospirae bacterium]|nr:B12-binding domain-containing radical SAM protein [Nitrospirota bacterium]